MQTNYEQDISAKVLIEQASDSDADSFKMLVDEFSGYAYNLAYKTLFNKDDAKDVVQESFIRVWKHIREYNPDIKFTTWLYKIVINLCYDKLKMERRKKMLFTSFEEDDVSINITGFTKLEDSISNENMIGVIKHISQGLPWKQNMVFVLRDLQNLTVEETSKILNMSVSSVKTNLFHARKFIAIKLSKIEKTESKYEVR